MGRNVHLPRIDRHKQDIFKQGIGTNLRRWQQWTKATRCRSTSCLFFPFPSLFPNICIPFNSRRFVIFGYFMLLSFHSFRFISRLISSFPRSGLDTFGQFLACRLKNAPTQSRHKPVTGSYTSESRADNAQIHPSVRSLIQRRRHALPRAAAKSTREGSQLSKPDHN